MSGQPSRFQTSSTFQSATYSYSSSSINGNTTSRAEATYSDPHGTKVYRKSQNPGEAPREERLEFDNTTGSLQDANAGTIQGRIEDVTEEENEAERQSHQNQFSGQQMRDQYAKRDGGA